MRSRTPTKLYSYETILEGLAYLTGYPYGCVEQTTSRTLPWLSLRELRGSLPELGKSDAEIAAAVEHGINLLLGMQTSSGGLGYWPGATEPMLWGSAYGGLALALAQRAGVAVPQQEFERLMKYLSAQLRGTAEDRFDGHYSYCSRYLRTM